MVPAKLLFVVLAVSVFIGAEALTCSLSDGPITCSVAGHVCMFLDINGFLVHGCNIPRDPEKVNKGCFKYRDMKVLYCDTDHCNKGEPCGTFTATGIAAQPTFLFFASIISAYRLLF